MTGKLEKEDVAAQASSLLIVLLFHCIIMGLGKSVQICVGNTLGINKPDLAKFISQIGVFQ